ncbi:DUF2958 domain-containing protein [Collinsella intestinalis]|uniref:DUF2958 domain-containing protein n=2 Tax=Collinsella intestinalis TaxID=147207 RepID=A0A414FW31_9ACTN|nr:DUF2958 domain-containing protein [Collinsella intestinalis]
MDGVCRVVPAAPRAGFPALHGLKGAHGTSHKSPLRSDWWRLPRTSLDPASLRGGFAESKAKAAQGAAKGFARKGERMGPRGPGEETGMQELIPKELAAAVPPLYATEDEAEPIARVKLFSCFNGWTWLVTEYDPESGEAYGLVKGFEEEWGYFSIREMEEVNRSKGFNVIERDFCFEPKPVSEAR